jgi:hypothetical protein
VLFLAVNLRVGTRAAPAFIEPVETDQDIVPLAESQTPLFAYVHDDLAPIVTAKPKFAKAAAEVLGGFASDTGAGQGRLAFGYLPAAEADRVASLISVSPSSR